MLVGSWYDVHDLLTLLNNNNSFQIQEIFMDNLMMTI